MSGGVASEDVREITGRVRPVWTEVGENVLRGYLQRENSMGSGTTAAGFGGKSDDFGLPKKVLDKGRWSQAPTSRSQRPATRAVSKACGISPLHRPGWSVSGIFKIKVVGRAKNSAFPSGCAVSGWRQYFFPLKVQTLRRYIKEKGREKLPIDEFLTF